jgi:hypothetical protein
MKFRKLRIAWSVFCGIACVLLIVLWVRSYWRAELVARLNDRWALTLGSNHGIIYFVYSELARPPRVSRWGYARIEVVAPDKFWEWKVFPTEATGQLPHLVLVGLCIIGAVAPWWPKRFSLRTLLIATTMVAMALGWAAYEIGK